MAKTIKDLYDNKVWEIDFSPEPSLAFAEGFESGANAVLEQIEKLVKFNRWAAQDLYELIEQLKK